MQKKVCKFLLYQAVNVLPNWLTEKPLNISKNFSQDKCKENFNWLRKKKKKKLQDLKVKSYTVKCNYPSGFPCLITNTDLMRAWLVSNTCTIIWLGFCHIQPVMITLWIINRQTHAVIIEFPLSTPTLSLRFLQQVQL